MNPNKDMNTLHIYIYTQESTINPYKRTGLSSNDYRMILDDDDWN